MDLYGATLNERLTSIRKSLDMNQDEFAAFVGISHRGYQSIEQGRIKSPGVETITKIALKTNTSMDFICTGRELPMAKSNLIIEVVSSLPALNEKQLRTLVGLINTAIETFTRS